jgi:dihydroorotase
MDLGLPGIPETAETIAIAQHLLLIEQSGVRAHFTCLSTARGVALIREAKAKGLNITADTAMHSLHLKEMDVGVFNANCHLYPPLRSEQDKQGLLAGLKDGTLDAICSDHRPLDSSAKLAPFADTLPGMSTFDTFLSLGLELVQQEKLALMTLIDRLTFQPAKILKLPIGSLSIGQNADICIFNPKKLWSVSEKTLISQGKNNAFLGRSLSGVVTHTFLNGHMVYGE